MDRGHGLLRNSWPLMPHSSRKHCKLPDFDQRGCPSLLRRFGLTQKKKSYKIFQAGVIFDQK